jgi:hypothetical protein
VGTVRDQDADRYVIHRGNVLEIIEDAAMLGIRYRRTGGQSQWNATCYDMPLLEGNNSLAWIFEAAGVDLDRCVGTREVPVPRRSPPRAWADKISYLGRLMWNQHDHAVHWAIQHACNNATPLRGFEAASEHMRDRLAEERRIALRRERGAHRAAVLAADLNAAENMAAGAMRVLSPLSALRVLSRLGLVAVDLRVMVAEVALDIDLLDQNGPDNE